MSNRYKHADCDKAIIEERLDDACEDCRNHMFKPLTPPDQPEDAALLKAIDDVVFRCFSQGQYWGTELDSDYLPEKPIDRTEANKLLMQLFHEHEQEKVQAVLDKLKEKLGFVGDFDAGGDGPSTWTILEAIGELQATQPPALLRDATKNSAADTTKQGEGESDEN